MSELILTPMQRLIVAMDFDPVKARGQYPKAPTISLRSAVQREILKFTKRLLGTGVVVKVNSGLRALDYDLIDDLHSFGLQVFADLKLDDIGNTLATDGVLLHEAGPDMVTVKCNTGVEAMRRLKAMLPETEVLGVTVLTNFSDADCQRVYGAPVQETVLRFAEMADEAGIDGLIASPKEIALLRDRFGERLTINTPGIRPAWAPVENDDQARVMTTAQAIELGATRVVLGRPIMRADDPFEAVLRTIKEIEAAVPAAA